MSVSLTPHSKSSLFPAGMIIRESSSDAAQMRELAAYWRIEQEQLEPGRYAGRITAFHTPRIQVAISDRSHGTRISGQVPDGTIAFAMVLPSANPTFFRYRRVAAREISVAFAGEEFLYQTMGASRVVSVAVCQRLAHERACSLWGEPLQSRCVDGRLVVSARTTAGKIGETLAALIESTLARPDHLLDPAHCARLEDSILRTLLSNVESSRPATSRSERRELAVKAKAYLRAHANEPLRMGDLCDEVGKSSRTLEIGFREAFGMSLKARLQAMRLNGAHRDLRAARGTGKTVKEIAFKWGFMHLGRFSVNYRKWFGQCPSDTLRG